MLRVRLATTALGDASLLVRRDSKAIQLAISSSSRKYTFLSASQFNSYTESIPNRLTSPSMDEASSLSHRRSPATQKTSEQ